MAEKPTISGPPVTAPPVSRLSQTLGRLGVYVTCVAAGLFVVAIGADLDVLALHAPLVGWLALLVGTGPLVALLLSTIASYINYYGTWRILRGKDIYEAREDLKTHTADIPQAVQSLLAERGGCVPAVSTVVLCLSLLLALATGLPSGTPFIGELGTWNTHLVFASDHPTPTPAPTPTITPIPTPTATPSPTPKPTPTPSPTPIPMVINFSIAPTTASWNDCNSLGYTPAPQTITLDNSGSNVSVSWRATTVESITGANGSPSPWAGLSGSGGTISANGKQSLTVTPVPVSVCYASAVNGTPWHVRIVVPGAGSYTFTYTIYYTPLQ